MLQFRAGWFAVSGALRAMVVCPYVRKVKTASGATAVQIAEKHGGVRRIVAHIGSAHDELELAVLVAAARQRVAGGQLALACL